MNDEQLTEQLQKTLDQRADALDSATLSRLHQARVRALEQPQHPWRQQIVTGNWLVAGSLAAAALVAITLWPQPVPELVPLNGNDTAIEMVELGADIELLENMDFYDWLASQEETKREA